MRDSLDIKSSTATSYDLKNPFHLWILLILDVAPCKCSHLKSTEFNDKERFTYQPLSITTDQLAPNQLPNNFLVVYLESC